MELRELEEPGEGTGSRAEWSRDAGRVQRRRLTLQGLWTLLAVLCAVSVLLLAAGFEEERSAAVGIVVRPVVEGAPDLPKAEPSFDAEVLRERFGEIAERYEGVYGVVAFEPDSGVRVSLRGGEEFMGASLGKLPVFAALYRGAAQGELDLEEEISVLPEDIQGYGSGGLKDSPEGYSLSLRECAYRLVNHSDNTAWAMLDRRLGEENIKAGLEDMGAENSLYSGHLSGYYTTPEDVLLLLRNISDPRFTSEELSAEMLDAMTQTYVEDRIPGELPQDVRVAHKTGSYEDNFSDAGIIFYKDHRGVEKRYYLVVLSRGDGEYEARSAIQEMSLATYEALADPHGS